MYGKCLSRKALIALSVCAVVVFIYLFNYLPGHPYFYLSRIGWHLGVYEDFGSRENGQSRATGISVCAGPLVFAYSYGFSKETNSAPAKSNSGR